MNLTALNAASLNGPPFWDFVRSTAAVNCAAQVAFVPRVWRREAFSQDASVSFSGGVGKRYARNELAVSATASIDVTHYQYLRFAVATVAEASVANTAHVFKREPKSVTGQTTFGIGGYVRSSGAIAASASADTTLSVRTYAREPLVSSEIASVALTAYVKSRGEVYGKADAFGRAYVELVSATTGRVSPVVVAPTAEGPYTTSVHLAQEMGLLNATAAATVDTVVGRVYGRAAYAPQGVYSPTYNTTIHLAQEMGTLLVTPTATAEPLFCHKLHTVPAGALGVVGRATVQMEGAFSYTIHGFSGDAPTTRTYALPSVAVPITYKVEQYPTDTVDYDFYYGNWLAEGDRVTTLTIAIDKPMHRPITAATSATRAKVWTYSGSTDGSNYTISVTAMTASNASRTDTLKVRVKGA